MMTRNYRSFIIFLGGLAGGVCLSLLIGIGLFYSQLGQIPTPNSQPSTETINLYQAPTSTPLPRQTNLLDDAEAALNSGEPERVKELLYPAIENWTSNNDRIRGYKLLGEAELVQGHAQLAVPYFEKLYFYQPSAENLFSWRLFMMQGAISNMLWPNIKSWQTGKIYLKKSILNS